MSPRQRQRLKERFNRKFHVGDRVRLRMDTHDLETTVKYPAEVVGDCAVAWFVGVAGCYSIEDGRVTEI